MPRNATAFQGQRTYTTPDGRKVVSVTTILQSWPKPWLGAWAAKMVAETAVLDKGWIGEYDNPEDAIRYLKGSPWRKRDTAADFGTAVHEALGQLVAEQPVTAPDGAEGHVAALREWWAAYRPLVLDSEIQVLNLEVGYAGSLDLICEVYGRRYLVDLKTGSTLGAEIPLQLAAYRYADHIFEDERIIASVPIVDACAVLWIPRDAPADWQFVEVEAGGAQFDQFLHLMATHSYVKEHDKVAIGTLILPQVEVR